jgi:hypothetical protein
MPFAESWPRWVEIQSQSDAVPAREGRADNRQVLRDILRESSREGDVVGAPGLHQLLAELEQVKIAILDQFLADPHPG